MTCNNIGMEVSFQIIVHLFCFTFISLTASQQEPFKWGRCGDPQCLEIIGYGVTISGYTSDAANKLSFVPREKLTIFARDFGPKNDLLGVHLRGQIGYVPQNMIQEERTIIYSKLLVSATVEFIHSHNTNSGHFRQANSQINPYNHEGQHGINHDNTASTGQNEFHSPSEYINSNEHSSSPDNHANKVLHGGYGDQFGHPEVNPHDAMQNRLESSFSVKSSIDYTQGMPGQSSQFVNGDNSDISARIQNKQQGLFQDNNVHTTENMQGQHSHIFDGVNQVDFNNQFSPNQPGNLHENIIPSPSQHHSDNQGDSMKFSNSYQNIHQEDWNKNSLEPSYAGPSASSEWSGTHSHSNRQNLQQSGEGFNVNWNRDSGHPQVSQDSLPDSGNRPSFHQSDAESDYADFDSEFSIDHDYADTFALLKGMGVDTDEFMGQFSDQADFEQTQVTRNNPSDFEVLRNTQADQADFKRHQDSEFQSHQESSTSSFPNSDVLLGLSSNVPKSSPSSINANEPSLTVPSSKNASPNKETYRQSLDHLNSNPNERNPLSNVKEQVTKKNIRDVEEVDSEELEAYIYKDEGEEEKNEIKKSAENVVKNQHSDGNANADRIANNDRLSTHENQQNANGMEQGVSMTSPNPTVPVKTVNHLMENHSGETPNSSNAGHQQNAYNMEQATPATAVKSAVVETGKQEHSEGTHNPSGGMSHNNGIPTGTHQQNDNIKILNVGHQQDAENMEKSTPPTVPKSSVGETGKQEHSAKTPNPSSVMSHNNGIPTGTHQQNYNNIRISNEGHQQDTENMEKATPPTVPTSLVGETGKQEHSAKTPNPSGGLSNNNGILTGSHKQNAGTTEPDASVSSPKTVASNIIVTPEKKKDIGSSSDGQKQKAKDNAKVITPEEEEHITKKVNPSSKNTGPSSKGLSSADSVAQNAQSNESYELHNSSRATADIPSSVGQPFSTESAQTNTTEKPSLKSLEKVEQDTMKKQSTALDINDTSAESSDLESLSSNETENTLNKDNKKLDFNGTLFEVEENTNDLLMDGTSEHAEQSSSIQSSNYSKVENVSGGTNITDLLSNIVEDLDLSNILNSSDSVDSENGHLLNSYQSRNLREDSANDSNMSEDQQNESGDIDIEREYDFYAHLENSLESIRNFIEIVLSWVPEPLYSTLMELQEKGISPRVPVFTALSAIPCILLVISLVYLKEKSKERKLTAQLAASETKVYNLSSENTVLEEKLEKAEAQISLSLTTLNEERHGFDGLKGEIVKLNQSLEKANQELDDSVKDIVTLKEREKEYVELVSDHEKTYLDLLEQKNQIEKQLVDQEDAAFTLTNQLEEKENTIMDLEQEKAQYIQSNEDLGSKLAQLQQNCNQLLQEAEVWNIRVNELNSKLSEEIETKEDLESSIKLKDSEIESLNNLVQTSKLFEEIENKEDFEEMKIDTKEEKLQFLINSSSILVQLKKKEDENKVFLDQLTEEKSKLLTMEVEQLDAQSEIDKLKLNYNQALQDRAEAQTKLEVLTNYFKDKEVSLQKQLGAQEAVRQKTEEDASSAERRITLIEKENSSYKYQVASMKQEVEETERNLKNQIAVQEKKAHENWIAARTAERKLEDMKQEITQLRQRLTLLEMEKENWVNSSREDIIRPVPKRLNDDSISSQDLSMELRHHPFPPMHPPPPMMLPLDRPLPPIPPPFLPMEPFRPPPPWEIDHRMTPPNFATPPRSRHSVMTDSDGPRQSSPIGSDLRDSRNSTPPHLLPDFHDLPPRPFFPPLPGHRFPMPPLFRPPPPGPRRIDNSGDSSNRRVQPPPSSQDSWQHSNSRV